MNVPQTDRPPRWLRMLAAFGARRGWPRAQVMLGAMLEREPPVNVNLDRANELYLQAAEKGNSQAMWNLGVNRLGTKGGRRDIKEALFWLRRAAENRHGLASWALGRLHLAGKLVDQDTDYALELLERAAKDGCRPAAETLISLYREGGSGVSRDPDKARQWSLSLLPWHQRLWQRLRPEG